MEKPAAKSKNKLLKLLPRAASAIAFHSFPFSPRRNKNKKAEERAYKLKSELSGKGFSDPILDLSAGQKTKSSRFETQEPTSPKISCMGNIKHRKKLAKNMHLFYVHKEEILSPFSSPAGYKNKPSVMKPVFFLPEVKKLPLSMRNGAFNNSNCRKSDASASKYTFCSSNRAPSLTQMKQFASCRGGFSNFDWEIGSDEWKYYSDEEIRDSDEEEEEDIIPFSSRILAGGGEDGITLTPRKEINLWRRRTI